jgi:methionyl-tRNA formyltransferase
MNITVLTNNDLASNLALNYLHQAVGQEHILRVLLSARVGKSVDQATLPKALQALRFIEQTFVNDILFPALGGRQNVPEGKLASFAELVKQGVSVQEIASINTEQGIATVQAGAPDLIISIRFGLILQDPVLNIARYGVINLHSGRLPDYRGVMACFRAMQDNQQEMATTVHYIRDASIDTGDIVSIDTMPIDYQASYLANLLALYKGGVASIVAAIGQIHHQGRADSHGQQAGGNYYSFPTEADLQAFTDKGLELFSHEDVVAFSSLYF